MKAQIDKKTLVAISRLSKNDRWGFFCPRNEEPENAAIRFLLFCLYYFPKTFFNEPSPAHHKAAELLHHTRQNDLNEFLFVSVGGVGKTMYLTAEVAYSILYQQDTLIAYQSAVQNNTYSFISRLINMMTEQDITEDFGLFVNRSLIGSGRNEKQRSQRRTDFTFLSGARVVSSNLFSSVRGLLHSDLGIQTTKISTLILDDIATNTTSMSARLKDKVESAVLEARRSLDKSNSRTILAGNITRGENICQKILKEKSMPHIVVPLTDQSYLNKGKEDIKIPKISRTQTNLTDVYLHKADAIHFNTGKQEHLHASWVERQYSDAGANWATECECRFWESSDLILGKYEGNIGTPDLVVPIKSTKLFTYKFDPQEYVFFGIDLGGGRHKDESAIIGLTESGIVCIALNDNTITPDLFADIIVQATEYTSHFIVGIEDDAGAGAECIRAVRKQISDLRLWRETSHDKIANKKSIRYGWKPTAATIEHATNELIQEYPSLQLNYEPLIQQAQTMTWTHLKERDTSLPHHFDLMRALKIANHMRVQRRLLKL